MKKADLHIHSTHSDGSLTSREILAQAREAGLDCLAFTEHDSTRFTAENVALGREYGVRVVPGVEISAYDYAVGKSAHILGYHFRQSAHIDALCAPVLRQRNENNLKRMEILKKLGFRIDEEAIKRLAADSGCIYKQHILAYLCATEQTDRIYGEVHRTLFQNGGPCDLKIAYADVHTAVRAIRADGGTAVLAHPNQQKNLYLVPELVSDGLSGIEMAHPANNMPSRTRIKRMCEQFQLICTGGSDFHGAYGAVDVKIGEYTAPPGCAVI